MQHFVTPRQLILEQVCILEDGRGGRIRTYDPLYPKQVRYQTAPRPEPCAFTNADSPD